MRNSERAVEVKVGFFVFLGLAIIAVMVVRFGSLGDGLQGFYPLTVDFPNASGLRKGSEVLMGGARVGWVAEAPRIEDSGRHVRVGLNITRGIEIPVEAEFQIGSSGLLGDRFVDVQVTSGELSGVLLEPGATVEGKREAGFDDLGREGAELLRELRETVAQVGGVVERVDEELLTAQAFEDLRESMAALRSTAEGLAEASGQIDDVFAKLRDLLDRGEEALQTVQGAVSAAERTLVSAEEAVDEEVRPALREAREALVDVRSALADALEGEGLLATLVNDPELSEDVKRLVANLRRHGILFYRDRSEVEGDEELDVITRERRARPRR